MDQELLAQIMFCLGMGSFPLSLVFSTIAVIYRRKRVQSQTFLAGSIVLLAHFVWYVKTMGTGLSDKLGNAVYPVWSNYMLFALGIIAAFFVSERVLGGLFKRK